MSKVDSRMVAERPLRGIVFFLFIAGDWVFWFLFQNFKLWDIMVQGSRTATNRSLSNVLDRGCMIHIYVVSRTSCNLRVESCMRHGKGMSGFRGKYEFVILLKLNNSWIPTIVSFCSMGQNCMVIQKWMEWIWLQ